MIEVIPAILTDDVNEVKGLLKKAEGVVKRVQIDIIDRVFADNKTIEPQSLKDYDGDLQIDYHLMVDEPVEWIEKCVSGMADRIIAQIEKMSNQVKFVGEVQKVGRQIGLAIDLKTPVSRLDSVILNNLDVVLVMSVPAGFGGQKFDKKVLNKIDELDEIRSRDDTPFRICDDGGITFESIDDARVHGVNEVSIGRRVFEGDIAGNVWKFKRSAYK